jgi:hypothetical protein
MPAPGFPGAVGVFFALRPRRPLGDAWAIGRGNRKCRLPGGSEAAGPVERRPPGFGGEGAESAGPENNWTVSEAKNVKK